MYAKTIAFCARLTGRQVLLVGLLAAFLMEAFTLVLRFGYDWQSTRDTADLVGTFTYGIRIHHGYIGVFLVPLAWCFPRGLRHAVWIVALGLIFSDLLHHFAVLWPKTGSPQFDFVYPDHPLWRDRGKSVR